jgi:hypothetical protein
MPARTIAVVLALALISAATASNALSEDVKSVSITKAWARATPGGATVGAAYGEIRNDGAEADTLVSATSPAAGRVEIHTHAHEDGVMKMRRLEKLEIPAKGSVTLAPGGHHIMLFDLAGPLKAGDRLSLTLTFEKAGALSAEAEVAAVGAAGPGAVAGESAESGSGSHNGAETGSREGSESGAGSH